MPPQVSVLMAVHNGAPFLQRTLDSILQQSLRDLELIVIDDGSTDESASMLAACPDPRLVVLRQPNAGQWVSLNRAFELSRGEFIALNDADDLSFPNRLAWQVRFLGEHPEIAAVGAQAVVVDESGRPIALTRLPANPLALRWQILFDAPFVHSATMVRRPVWTATSGYRTDDFVGPVADYELASRIARDAAIANARLPLVAYREHRGGITKRKAEAFRAAAPRIRAVNIEAEFADPGLAVRASGLARTLRLEEIVTASVSEVGEAVDTLLALERAFFHKYRAHPLLDSKAATEIRIFTMERLLAALPVVCRYRASAALGRVVVGLLAHSLRLLQTWRGTSGLSALARQTVLRVVLGNRQFHMMRGRRALRRAAARA